MWKSLCSKVALLCLVAAASTPAFATLGPLGLDWNASVSGYDPYGMGSTLTIGSDTLSYSFNHPGYAYDGVPQQTYVFSTTASNSGVLNLTIDIDLTSFAAWYQSYTDMYLWTGSTANTTWLAGNTWGAVETVQQTLNLTSGESWGFMAVGGNYDGTGILSGSFTVTDATPAPEPASLALLGLGLAGLGVVRRRKQQAK